MKKARPILAAVAVLALALASAVGTLCTPVTKANAAAGSKYTQNFTSAAAVNADFTAYYQLTMGAASTRTSVGESDADETNFYVANGELVRHSLDGDISSSYTTDSFAILTFTKQQYVNFDLTVDYQMGDASDFWPVVAFRQQEAGKYFLETGAGVFVQKEGKVTLWGSDVDGIGGPYENSVSVYSRSGWHTLRVRLDGLDLSVWLDGSASPVLTRKLPLSSFKRGYVSLMSINNDTRFKNFSITELAVKAVSQNAEQKPAPDADTPDALANMAQKVENIDELAGHTPAEQTPVPEPAQKSGCNGTANAAALPAAMLALVAACGAACIGKKRHSC